ncbi:hypothetical protein WK23_11455 [Burkholderia vietnamiensis]|nr:hypothetical protein WK23_11455 [Burkholderia vietnamiensis]
MRVDFFVRKGWVPGARDEHVFAQQIAHAKPAHLSTAAIDEDRQFGRALGDQGTSANEFAQKLRSARPDRTHSHLVALATQPDLWWWVEPQVTDPQIKDLLHTSAGVEHQREQCKVALPRRSTLVDGGQQCIDLSRFQIFDRCLPRSPLKRYPEYLLKRRQMFGMLGNHETRKCMNGGEPSIARRDAVAALGLKVFEESFYVVGIQIAQIQGFDWAPALSGGELQQQDDGIPVAPYRVHADAAQCGQIVLEEAQQTSAELGRFARFHGLLPPSTWPKCFSKRSLASAAIVGTNGR